MNADHSHKPTTSPLTVAAALSVVLAAYGVGLFLGIPQAGTEQLLAEHHHAGEHHDADEPKGESHTEQGHDADGHHDDDHAHDDADHDHETGEHAGDVEHSEEAAHERPKPPSAYTVLPFVLLLGAIATFPLWRATETWWESNLHRFYVAAGLALTTLFYYLVMHDDPVAAHFLSHDLRAPNPDGLNWDVARTVLENALLNEYVPFIVLLFSLYTISGGIRIHGNLRPTPLTNTAFIAAGGAMASFVGTTGAAMLLIRPVLETNRVRKIKRHTIIFFIFVVCNCGGLLLPIGDPPLFLGYLRGVPFLWTLNLILPWLLVNGLLLAVYYLWDSRFAFPREDDHSVEPVVDQEHPPGLQADGLWNYNIWLLLGVVLSVALLDPSKPLPGTDWHAPVFLREAVQLLLVVISLLTSPGGARQANAFSYHAILEVAALFVGIFICMQPALQNIDYYASKHGAELGLGSPTQFFWLTGILSSVLDNAPTYVVFFDTARSLPQTGSASDLVAETGVPSALLAAISLGSVFMGAMTYIGNGPNFMVKAIAEKSGVRMPTFLGYLVFSMAVLVPIFILTNLLLSLLNLWALPLMVY